jgi:hypothetical protein
MTAQGHPRAIFKRAVESGSLVAADASVREIGSLTPGLGEAGFERAGGGGGRPVEPYRRRDSRNPSG